MKLLSKISGMHAPSLGQVLKNELTAGEVSALGVVSAFVSIAGFRDLLAITSKHKLLECRLLVGLSNAITHPQALTEALDAGWKVRLGSASRSGIFHPKMILSGRKFLTDGSVKEPSFAYVGSSNLTNGGLHKNIECGVITYGDFAPPSLVPCFVALWDAGKRATTARIQSYAEEFSRRNRQRSLEDMRGLGVSDITEEKIPTYSGLSRRRTTAKCEALPESAAGAAWAGLESFTGEYQFQVEFPQAAGLVLKRIIRSASRQHVRIFCTGDNRIRDMSYGFYADNGMFRLNVPNDTPGVQRARQSRNGIALVEVSDQSNAAAQLTILAPGNKLQSIVGRSFLLGTWGNTPTRLYGWY